MDEKYHEMAKEIEENRIKAAIANRVRYSGNFTHCKNQGCGEPLPKARSDIGTCIDCARDKELLELRNKRLYNE